MKYIRKEISKGVKPIADQDFKITGDIDITGNYLQNGSPFSSFDATASNTFTASQKVDVTDNSNPAFKITQKGTGDALLVEDDAANPDTTPFVIKADGKVGVGTTSPAQPLDVVGNINTTGNYLQNGSPLASFDKTSANVFTAQQTFRRNGSSDDAVVVTENSDTAARVKLATDGSITLATATNNWKIVISGTNLIFSTGGVNKMKLDASGNLTVVGDVTAFGTI